MHRPIAASLTALTLAAALGGSQPVRAAADPSTVVIAQGVDADTLNPILSTITPTFNVVHHVYERLLDRRADGSLEPRLALSWRRVNPTTEEYKLRPNVKFSNGDPFTSADVKYTIEWIKNSANRSQQTAYVRDIDRVETPDPLTVRFISNKPNAIPPGQNNIVFIVDAKYFQEKGNDYVAGHPIGTGAYVMREWRRDDQISFDANPTWWNGKPKIEHVIFKPIPDAATRVAALKTGDVDLITNVPPQYAISIEGGRNTRMTSVRSLRQIYIAFNTLSPGPQQNKAFRLALNYAVDVPAIVKSVLGGRGYESASVIPPNYVGYDAAFVGYKHDLVKAKALLAQAGFASGKVPAMVLNSPDGRYNRDKEVSEAIAGQLTAFGVPTTVRTQEWTTYYGQSARKQLTPMYLLGWGQPSADADGIVTPLFESISPLATFNDPKLDALIEAGRVELNPTKRKAIYAQAATLIRDEGYWMPLFEFEDLYGVSRRLNWKPSGNEYIRAYEMSFK